MDFKLEKAQLKDAELIRNGQRVCFLPLLDRYQDHDVNPCNTALETISERIKNHYFYKIIVNDIFVGAIFIHENPDSFHLKLHTVYVLPEYQGKGFCQKAISEIEAIHNTAKEWVLETPHDLTRNHHVYEKMGYRKNGKVERVNDNLSLIYYEKIIL